MTTVADILEFMEKLAPRCMKMEWDNVGLLCGSKNAPVRKILVALDPFEHVCQEAVQWEADLIVTHHPLIFRPVASVTDGTSIGRSIMILCKNGISAINAHTNLDQAPDGVNAVLAQTLGLTDIQVIDPKGLDADGREWGLLHKGNVPHQDLEQFLSHVKKSLGCQGLRYVQGGKDIHTVAVGGGACADGLLDALDAGCDTFITSDVKYNQFWDAKELGINLIDAGHFATENPVIPVLAAQLSEAFPDAEVKISQTHADCMKFY